MADVLVRDDKVREIGALDPASSATISRETGGPGPGLSRLIAVAVGTGSAVILAAYVATGSVRIEAGPRSGVRYRVDTIWADFTAYLSRLGAGPEIVLAVVGLAGLSLLGSCILIGLAFAMRDEVADTE